MSVQQCASVTLVFSTITVFTCIQDENFFYSPLSDNWKDKLCLHTMLKHVVCESLRLWKERYLVSNILL